MCIRDSVTTGAVVIDGGVGIGKSIIIGENIIPSTDSSSDIGTNTIRFANVYADNFVGNGANLSNTGAQMSQPTSGADQFMVFTDVTSGTMITGGTDPGLKYDVANNRLKLHDNIALAIGTNSDTLIYHVDGSSNGTRIDHTSTANDDLRFRLGANQMVFEKISGENFILCDHSSGLVRLHHNGSEKLVTTSSGIDITGALDVSTSATIDNILIDVDARTISTNSNAALILTSGNSDVEVTGELFISDKLHIASTTQGSSSDGSIHTQGGILAEKQIHSNNDIVAFSSSDITLKENISPIQNALDKVMSLTGNVFAWKPEASKLGNKGMDTGILAQEVEKLGLPGVTRERNGIKSVRYERLIPVLIEAVKELTEKVKSLESNK